MFLRLLHLDLFAELGRERFLVSLGCHSCEQKAEYTYFVHVANSCINQESQHISEDDVNISGSKYPVTVQILCIRRLKGNKIWHNYD